MSHALVIDDNKQNLKILSQLLSKQGVSCTEISDPKKIVDMLPTLGEVDVIFLDLEMPGLNGYKAKDLLKSHFTQTPVIAYTVHISEINVVKQMGFDGFIGKPLDNARFPDQLARILNGDGVWERT